MICVKLPSPHMLEVEINPTYSGLRRLSDHLFSMETTLCLNVRFKEVSETLGDLIKLWICGPNRGNCFCFFFVKISACFHGFLGDSGEHPSIRTIAL